MRSKISIRHSRSDTLSEIPASAALGLSLPRRYHGKQMTRPIRILGIDPGLRRTGWGVVEIAGNRLGFVGCGSVTTNDREALALRLLAIHDGLMAVLERFSPDEAAVEQTF